MAANCTAMYAMSNPSTRDVNATHCCGKGGYVVWEKPAYHFAFQGLNQC